MSADAREIGLRFSRLTLAILDGRPVDPNEVLVAASDFLDAAQGGEPTSLSLARRMATSACDWAVFGRPEDYSELTRAIACFRMYRILQTSGVDYT